MKRILLYATIFSFFLSLSPSLQAQEQEQRQYVSWGIVGGPNLSSYIMRVDPLLRDTLIADSMLNSLPATGLSLGLFFDYHITDRWYLQFNGQCSLEQSTLRYSDHHSHLLTIGIDIGLSVFYRAPWRDGHLLFALGPYCHFVRYSTATEGINLYRRQVYTDPTTGKSRFAMSDIHAGIALTLGYEFAQRWLVQAETKFGITDILNLETPGTYVYPFKVTFGVGCRF